MSGFIQREDLLDEDSRVDDLLDFSQKKNDFQKKILSVKKPSILALVGRFGTGKSTMLHQLEKEMTEDVLWVNFDAWKYPDRRDLWEGLILDFADQSAGTQKKKRTLKKVEGKSADNKFDIITDFVGLFKDIPVLNVMDKMFKEFFEVSPAKRVFELQAIFTGLIDSADAQNIYIVVEDIDRSGDAGVFFLETLKQFIRSINTEKNLLVIVPMGEKNYEIHLDSYLKCIDYVDFFSPRDISLNGFVDAVFEPSLFEGQAKNPRGQIVWTGSKKRTQIISFLELLMSSNPSITLRMLKLILRKANVVYVNQVQDGYEPDLRVTILVEFSKYFKMNATNGQSFFDSMYESRSVPSSSIYGSFVEAMIGNNVDLLDPYARDPKSKSKISAGLPIRFTLRQGANPIENYPSYPWIGRRGLPSEQAYGICDYYLEY